MIKNLSAWWSDIPPSVNNRLTNKMLHGIKMTETFKKKIIEMACYNQNKIFRFKFFTIILIVETFVFNVTETNGLPLEEYNTYMTWKKMLQNGSLANYMISILM